MKILSFNKDILINKSVIQKWTNSYSECEHYATTSERNSQYTNDSFMGNNGVFMKVKVASDR